MWLADTHIVIEPARSWQLTFPVVRFVLCFGATGVFDTPNHPRLLVRKGQTTDFGRTHADGGDDVYVLDDVTIMNRDIREHFPFLVIGRLEWLFLLPKVVLIRLFIRMQTKQYTRSMLKKSQKMIRNYAVSIHA